MLLGMNKVVSSFFHGPPFFPSSSYFHLSLRSLQICPNTSWFAVRVRCWTRGNSCAYRSGRVGLGWVGLGSCDRSARRPGESCYDPYGPSLPPPAGELWLFARGIPPQPLSVCQAGPSNKQTLNLQIILCCRMLTTGLFI
jgi:hypothetical protein